MGIGSVTPFDVALQVDPNARRPVLLQDGTVGVPAIAFTTQAGMGFYKEAGGTLGLTIAGLSHDWTSTGYSILSASASITLGTTDPVVFSRGAANRLDITATAGVRIAGDMLPATDDNRVVGSAALRWKGVTSDYVYIYTGQSDAQPSARMGPSHVALGLGGAAAVSARLDCLAANRLDITATAGVTIPGPLYGSGGAAWSLFLAANYS